jgi:hypothetical protein
MPKGRPRKTRVTKEEVRAIREAKLNAPSSSQAKRMIKPGPWTDVKTRLKVNAKLRVHRGLLGDMYGIYRIDEKWNEKGWYPVVINITSDKILEDITKFGIDEYMAACEVSLNKENQYGHLILLNIFSDNSSRNSADQRFLSCYAKTNKKGVTGFAAIRQGMFKII